MILSRYFYLNFIFICLSILSFKLKFGLLSNMWEFPGILPSFFFENKSMLVFSVVMVSSVVIVTLLYHPFFAVIPLLRGNSDTINK